MLSRVQVCGEFVMAFCGDCAKASTEGRLCDDAPRGVFVGVCSLFRGVKLKLRN